MVSVENIKKAQDNIYRYISPTPLHYYSSLSQLVEANVYIKHENHLPGGSFKIRGGLNLMYHLRNKDIAGVITFSTGNHGISVATAANVYGVPATVVVPLGSNVEKIAQIKALGAKVVEAGDNFEEAALVGREIKEKENLYFIHAANNEHLINGVGTEFLEIVDKLPDIDAMFIPIGGGSELASAVTVLKDHNPNIQIYAVQAESSQAAYQSWKGGEIVKAPNKTFAGGFATGEGFELPFSIYHDKLSDFILLTEDELMAGISMAIKHTHNLAEAAGASTIMAMLKVKEQLKGKNIVLQMSGCNETMDVIHRATSDCGCQ